MSEVHELDLVDAITEWVERADEDLDEHDIEAILRIQLAVDASWWSGVAIAELTQGDVASLKHHLRDVDAPEFTAWVIDETLRYAELAPRRGPARKAPSGHGRDRSKTRRTKTRDTAGAGVIGARDEDRSPPDPDADGPDEADPIEADPIEADPIEADPDEADPDEDRPDDQEPEGEASTDEDLGEDDLFDPDDGDDEELDSAPADDAASDESELDDLNDEAASDESELDDLNDEAASDESDQNDDASDESELDDLNDEAASDDAMPLGGGTFAAAINDEPLGGIFAAATSPSAEVVDGSIGSGAPEGLAAEDRGAGFFAELERETTASVTGPAPIELRDAPDALGPSFLPPSDNNEGRARRIGVFALAALAIAAFVFAGIQLVNNVNQSSEDEVAVHTDASTDDGSPDDDRDDEADAADDADPDDDATDRNDGNGSDDGSDTGNENDDDAEDDEDELTPEEAAALLLATPEPTPERELPPAETTAIVLTDDGDIWSIDLYADGFGDPILVHDSDEYAPAIDVSLVAAGLGVVDDEGDAHIVNRTDPDERVRVWRGDRLGDARMLVEGSDQYAVLDAKGSVSLFDANRAATRISADTVWDTNVGGTPPARDIDSYIDLVAFSVGDGDVRLIQTSADDNPIFPIWDGETQPRAYNVDLGSDGLLMGVDGGAIARYQWFEEGPPLSAVWDPLAGTRLPAIGYASLEDGTAVVLNNGSVAAIDESGDGPLMWDAEVSDLRAVSVSTLGDEVLLILDGGTVLRVAADGETENRGSIWDVTDESTSPAVKVLIAKP